MAMNEGARADRIAQAEAAILSLKAGYKDQLALDVAEVGRLWEQIDVTRPDAAVLRDLFSMAHNIKGQAGSFGYDLVTEIGSSMCNLLRNGTPTETSLGAVGHHVQVLRRVVERDVTGNGGTAGRKIMEKLAEISNNP